MTPALYYHPRMLAYDFGPQHPFRPERLARCVELLGRYGVVFEDPEIATEADAMRVHAPEYLAAFRAMDRAMATGGELAENDYAATSEFVRHGFLSSDNPPFPGMWNASLGFIAGTVRAAEGVRDGAPLGLTLAGGLHHASRVRASGFCLLDDPAIAVAILLERFDRVAYVDIDLHHGDGVQWIWYDDPRVLTCSIHQDGRTLFPGTGSVEETGAAFTSLNVPLSPGTTGDVWLAAFRQTVLPALALFEPEAIVLQMGADPHFLDPLGHLQVAAQDWLEAVLEVKRLGLPLVACGGGGYSMNSVVRMWCAAALTLLDVRFEDRVPDDLAQAWSMPTFFDANPPGPSGSGQRQAEAAVSWLSDHLLPRLEVAARG